jgi:hypothetical protein
MSVIRRLKVKTQILKRLGEVSVIVLMSFLIATGAVRFSIDVLRRNTDNSLPMMEFVSEHKSPEDTYLIPTDVKNFRLITGAPIFVDFKSVPHLDTDVLEWYDRVQKARIFYRDSVDDVNCDLLDRFETKHGVTHVVLDEELLSLSCPHFDLELYRDEHFAVYQIIDGS